MKKEEKKQLISDLNAVFAKSALVVVSHNLGMTMADVSQLRSAVRADGASYKVAKNRLTKLALAGTPCEGLADMMKGPTTLAYSEDPITAARAVVKMAKTNEKLQVLGGIMNGQVVDKAKIEELASLPSLDELRGKLVGLLVAPAGKVARVFKAYADKAQPAEQ